MAENTDQRIARLQRELDDLKAARAAPPTVTKPIIEEGTRILYTRLIDIDLPNEAEAEKLLAAVVHAYPRFEFDIHKRGFVDGFVASMWRIGQLKRTEKMTRLTDWAIECDNFLHQPGGMRGDPMNGSFTAAVLASGDVRWTRGNSALGIPARVGLDFHGSPARAAWREVLERGTPRAPDADVDTRAPSSPSRVHFY